MVDQAQHDLLRHDFGFHSDFAVDAGAKLIGAG
jgi:hypothetical protein